MLEDRQLLQSGDMHSLPLLAFLVKRYGIESLGWSPQTIRMEIADDYKLNLPQQTFDRLMAGIAIATGNEFYVSPVVFMQLCNVMGDKPFNPETVDPADPFECGWGMVQAMLISPPSAEENGGSLISAEVDGYIAYVLDAYGMSLSPKCLAAVTRAVQSGEVGIEYAADPDMFAAINSTQQSAADEVDAFVGEQLREVKLQLDAMQLCSGTAEELINQLRGDLKGGGKTSQ